VYRRRRDVRGAGRTVAKPRTTATTTAASVVVRAVAVATTKTTTKTTTEAAAATVDRFDEFTVMDDVTSKAD